MDGVNQDLDSQVGLGEHGAALFPGIHGPSDTQREGSTGRGCGEHGSHREEEPDLCLA